MNGAATENGDDDYMAPPRRTDKPCAHDDTECPWTHYGPAVRDDLTAVWKEVAKVREQVTEIRIEVARLGVRAGIWGALIGAIPALITLAVLLLRQTGQ